MTALHKGLVVFYLPPLSQLTGRPEPHDTTDQENKPHNKSNALSVIEPSSVSYRFAVSN